MKKLVHVFIGMLLAMFLVQSGDVLANDNGIVEVPDLATLRAEGQTDGTVYRVTGEIVLTHQNGNRNQKYFQDDTGAILVDDNGGIITTEYDKYDGITGLTGTLSFYAQLLQMVPVEDPGEATSSNNVVEPLVLDLADITPEHQAMLIMVQGVTFVSPPHANFQPSTSYTIEDASGEGTLRTPHVNAGLDYFGTPIPSTERDIIAVINQFNETMQVMPRSLADFIAVGSFDVTFVVKDESDVPIDDAVITFDGETMDPGHYVFEDVAIGTYSYSVARAGYNTVSGSMLIEEDIEILIIMVKPDEENMITDFPWTEDFDGDEFPPAGWKKYSFGDTGDWGLVDGWAHHTFTPEGEEANSWLVTTQIQLPDESVMLLSFLERNQFMDDYGYSGVLVSNGSGNPEHGHFVELYESSQPITGSKETMVSLADYAGELIYIAFVYQGEYAHRWWVDNIMIDFAPEAIEVPDIATLKEQTISPDLVYRITGEVVITVLQRAYRNQFYVQDASGAILIDDAPIVVETDYDLYDGITGLTGKLGEFQDMLQVLPTEDPGEATSHNNVVDPLEITLADITSDHQGLLVLVRNVSFDLDASPADFTHNQSYYIFDDTGEGEIRTPNSAGLFDYFETPVPTTPKDIVGVLHQRFAVVRLQPRMLADFMEPSSVPHIDPANIVLYPNPASTHFYIESHERQIDSVRMFNLNGQLVAEQSVTNTGQVKMDVTGMKNGIYMVQIIMNNQVVVHKVHINK